MTSDYDLAMAQDKECSYLCKREVDGRGVKRARKLIEEGYVVEWIIDNLPGATSFVTVDKSHKYYAAGFKLGYIEASSGSGRTRYFINNHFTIVIRWRRAPGKAGLRGSKVIVGFEVFTKSMEVGKRDRDGCPQDVHGDNEGMELYLPSNNSMNEHQFEHSSYTPPADDVTEDGSTLAIPYTYAVYFREDERVEWAKRWDIYFNGQSESTSIHWLAIVNSFVICALLTALVVMILSRTTIGDPSRGGTDGNIDEIAIKLKSPKVKGSNQPAREKTTTGLLDQMDGSSPELVDDSSDGEYAEDVSGWKLLHADVFRTPSFALLLAPLVGSGTQLVFMAVGLLLLSALGILNPSFRGGFASTGMALFIFAGLFSGYFSSRIYKTFSGQNWRANAMTTAVLVPGLLFFTFFILNLIVWTQGSSTALPFSTLVALVFLWLFIQLPLVYVGSWYSSHYSSAYEHPTKTASIPRQIPPQPWYISRRIYTVLLAGLVPFAVIFIELLYIFRSLWQDKSSYYYVFGLLTVISSVNIIAVVEVTIVATYIQLCAENYHWWWQSVFTGAGSALWIFAYCTWFYMTRLHIKGFVSAVLFFGYSVVACSMYGLLMGTLGFLTAYALVRKMYG